MTLGDVVRRSRVVVCVGPGGAGKTTVSAAVALQGAADGRRTLALTIDPAPRLASALEVRGTGGNASVAVGRERLLEAGVPTGGSLDVMVLDVKAVFDDLVSRLSPDDVTRRRILSNRYYRVIADSLAGSHEFMALELLRTAVDGGRYDLVVLDTPPTGGFLDFLSAPRRLLELLESPEMALMARSAALAERLTFGLSALWTNVVLKAMGKVVGLDVLGDVWSFYRDIDPIREPLRKRARATFDLVRGPETAYIVVTRAEEWLLEETRTLKRALKCEGCRVGGVVVNRLVDVPPSGAEQEESVPCVGSEEGLALRVRRATGLMERLAVSQRTVVEGLRKGLGRGAALVTLSELEAEIYEIAGIEKIRRALFGRRQ